MFIIIFRAIQLVAVRAYSPWLYPEIIYSIYCKFTGCDSVFKQSHTLPVYVCFILVYNY